MYTFKEYNMKTFISFKLLVHKMKLSFIKLVTVVIN